MKNKHFRHRTKYKGVNEDLIFLRNCEWYVNDKLKREEGYNCRFRFKLERKLDKNFYKEWYKWF